MRERWTERVWLSGSDTAFILQFNLIFTINHYFECPLRKAISLLYYPFICYFLVYNPVSVSVIIKVFTADSLIKIVSYKIYKIIVDLGVWHDTRREKYCIRHDTNGETVGFLLSLEYRTPGKGSQPIRFEDQKELCVCLCIYCMIVQKVHNTQYFIVMTLILKSLTPWWGIYIYIF